MRSWLHHMVDTDTEQEEACCSMEEEPQTKQVSTWTHTHTNSIRTIASTPHALHTHHATNTSTLGSGTPNIYIQPGATVNATIHQHFYPPSSSGSAFDTIAQPPFHAHHPHQCRLCDHTFPSPTLLTDHKLLNRHHCPCCRQCFADWETHLLRSPHMLCPIDGCGRSFATDDMFKEHFWSMHYYYFSYGGGADGGGRRGGTTVETRAIEYDPDWIGVIEEEESRTRRSRSRTRRRRSRVRRRSSRHFLYY